MSTTVATYVELDSNERRVDRKGEEGRQTILGTRPARKQPLQGISLAGHFAHEPLSRSL